MKYITDGCATRASDVRLGSGSPPRHLPTCYTTDMLRGKRGGHYIPSKTSGSEYIAFGVGDWISWTGDHGVLGRCLATRATPSFTLPLPPPRPFQKAFPIRSTPLRTAVANDLQLNATR